MADLRQELQNRISAIQQEVNDLKAAKEKTDQRLKEASSKLTIWRQAYDMEAERLGEPNLPLFTRDTNLRFADKKLSEALDTIRKENPQITKRDAATILNKQGFDFQGKKPVRVVHAAWVALDRKAQKGGT